MSRAEFNVKERYVGTGSLADYTFDFKITSLDQLKIIKYTNAGVKVFEVDGNDTTYLSGVVFDSSGGTVTLLANLTLDYVLVILLAPDEPTQSYEFRNKSDFTLSIFEAALDALAGPIQRLMYLGKRSLRLSDNLSDADFAQFDTAIPVSSINTVIEDNAGKIIAIGNDNKSLQLGPTVASINTNVASAAADAAAAAASASSAFTYSSNAAASAAAAATSATTASSAATTASSAATTASSAATTASSAATSATASAAAASASQIAAAASAAAAASSATTASSAATTASTAATNASTSATNAATSATNAAASAVSTAADAATVAALLATVSTLSLVSKYNMTYTDFAAAALSKSTLFRTLQTKGYIEWILIKHQAAFTGGAVATATLETGLVADTDYYSEAFDVFQAPGATLIKKASQGGDVQSFSAGIGIYATLRTTGANTNALTAGQVEIYVKEGLLP